MTIKINKSQQELFVTRLANKVFTPKFDELQVRINAQGRVLYDVLIPAEVVAVLKKLPRYLVHVSNWFTFDMRSIPNLAVFLGEPMPMTAARAAFTPWSGYNHWVFESDLSLGADWLKHEHYKSVDAAALLGALQAMFSLGKELEGLRNSKDNFKEKMGAALTKITTLERLQKDYPELAAEWGALMKGEAPVINAPAVIIDDCLELIRQAGQKAAEARAA